MRDSVNLCGKIILIETEVMMVRNINGGRVK